MTRVIGWYLLAGCALGFASVFKVAMTATSVFVPLTTVPLVLWGVAGAFLLAKKPIGRWLAMAALVFQLPTFDIGAISYHFSPIYGIVIGQVDSRFVVQFDLGVNMWLQLADGSTYALAIDLVAVYGIVILLRAIRSASRAS
jgi:hypothetical protein